MQPLVLISHLFYRLVLLHTDRLVLLQQFTVILLQLAMSLGELLVPSVEIIIFLLQHEVLGGFVLLASDGFIETDLQTTDLFSRCP